MTETLKTYVRRGVLITVMTAAVAWLAGNPAFAETYKLRVDGLACPFCAYGIEKQLDKLPGVINLKTDIKSGTVTVKTSKGKKIATARLRAAVKRAGFTLRSVK